MLPLLFSKLIIYLFYNAFVLNCSLSVVDTMLNPILSDYFGFTTRYQSLFFLGIVVLIAISSGIM